ncbi:MAG: ribokinase [Anaerolineales bacterium]|nr:ribokinase [Anaerolineales bacterium]
MGSCILVIGLYGQSMLFHVDEFPIDGETVPGDLISIEPGGKGYNQAVSAARNNVPVRFITAVGDDDFGNRLLKDCKTESIDGSYSVTLSRYRTAIASVISDKHAYSRIIVSNGACGQFRSEYLLDDAFIDCGILLLQLELPIELALFAAKKAKENNTFVILDPAPAQDLPKELVDMVDIVTPNFNEALKLTACSPASSYESIATKLHELGYKNVLITLGENGVYVSLNNGENYLLSAVDVDAVDTTGAGDTFNGSLAASLYEGNNIKQSIEIAIAASCLCVTRNGVMESIPYKAEIEKFKDNLRRM